MGNEVESGLGETNWSLAALFPTLPTGPLNLEAPPQQSSSDNSGGDEQPAAFSLPELSRTAETSLF